MIDGGPAVTDAGRAEREADAGFEKCPAAGIDAAGDVDDGAVDGHVIVKAQILDGDSGNREIDVVAFLVNQSGSDHYHPRRDHRFADAVVDALEDDAV